MTNVVIEITLANIINKREKGMLLYRGNKREISDRASTTENRML